MSLIINTNVASLVAQRHLSGSSKVIDESLGRLASGYRILRAADDVAGLQISETLRAQMRGTSQAIDNAQDGKNLLDAMEGTLSTVQENLQHIRQLTVQAANDTNGDTQREAIHLEIMERIDDITRLTEATQWNQIKLLHRASSPASLILQVGANDDPAVDIITVLNASNGGALGDTTATALGLDVSSGMVATNSSALAFLTTVDNAMTELNRRRAYIGSVQNRLENALENLQITLENISAAESRIRNVDVAKEASELARNQILQQVSASLLFQANQAPLLAVKLIAPQPPEETGSP